MNVYFYFAVKSNKIKLNLQSPKLFTSLFVCTVCLLEMNLKLSLTKLKGFNKIKFNKPGKI